MVNYVFFKFEIINKRYALLFSFTQKMLQLKNSVWNKNKQKPALATILLSFVDKFVE